MKELTITTDGACLSNPGPGGWAALLKFGPHEKVHSGHELQSTNNRMELKAVIEGLRLLKEPCSVTLVVDSRYVMDAFEKGWILNWRNNGWKTADKKPVKNQELWEDLYAVSLSHTIRWVWVKGHNGHPDNERVDQAAQAEAYKAKALVASAQSNEIG
ncbi:MAG: ribonuclease HI [Bdellovibrionota bacterium]|nr:MAG: ribonuclease HI [Pseudomonadota bacterium]